MCKEMPVIPVNMVVDKKRIIGKMEVQGGGEAQRVADPPKKYPLLLSSIKAWLILHRTELLRQRMSLILIRIQ
jgi:hypothetical protein